MGSQTLKIAIVGAGISGLSAFLCLKRHLPSTIQYEIQIFESYPSPTRKERELECEEDTTRSAASFTGGGLGVAPNGMRVLREMDPEIHDAVVAQGYPILRFQMKNSWDWTLGSMPSVDSSKQPPEVMVMSSRQGVWDCLRDKIPSEIIQNKKPIDKIGRGSSHKPILEFADGSKTGEFDLVVGADGVKSVVKAAVLQSEPSTPVYQGVCGIGGFVPSSYLTPIPPDNILSGSQSPCVMTFGAEGFFGYAPCETDKCSTMSRVTADDIKSDKVLPYGPQAMWWSTFEADEPEKITKDFDAEAVHNQLIERHSKWKDPVIKKVLADPRTSVLTATYTTPKLHTWTGDSVVIIGDAAHCLPSSSGQGVSQALEDTQCLAILLAHYLQDESSYDSTANADPVPSQHAAQVNAATAAFQFIRKPRVEKILDISSRMGGRKKKMGLIGEWTTYAFMWVLCAFISWRNINMYDDWDVQTETKKAIHAQEKKLRASPTPA